MRKLVAATKDFLAREEGATMVEYGLMVALIALFCVAAVQVLGGSLSNMFTTTGNTLNANQSGS